MARKVKNDQKEAYETQYDDNWSINLFLASQIVCRALIRAYG